MYAYMLRMHYRFWCWNLNIPVQLRGFLQPVSAQSLEIRVNENLSLSHDDVIKWKYGPRSWPFVRAIHRRPVNFPHKGKWRRVLMFSLICAWINRWVNNREAGDLRRHHAHYDVIVMCPVINSAPQELNHTLSPTLEKYREISNISRTKSPYFNNSRPILQLSLLHPLKPRVKSRMNMLLEQRRQAVFQLHLSDQRFYCLLRCNLYGRFDGNSLNDHAEPTLTN